MSPKNKISEKLATAGIVPVIRLNSTEPALPLAKTLLEGGLPVAEITLRTPCALDCIKMITREYPEMLVGAGTVLTVAQANNAIEAGAQFIVSPGLIPEMVSWCFNANIPVYPGVLTPTEICQALALGLRELKFFPASNFGGIKTVKSLLSVFNQISFMPTGGITLDNCREYLETQGILCCGGTFIAPPALVDGGEFEKIGEIVKETVSRVSSIVRPQSEL